MKRNKLPASKYIFVRFPFHKDFVPSKIDQDIIIDMMAYFDSNSAISYGQYIQPMHWEIWLEIEDS